MHKRHKCQAAENWLVSSFHRVHHHNWYMQNQYNNQGNMLDFMPWLMTNLQLWQAILHTCQASLQHRQRGPQDPKDPTTKSSSALISTISNCRRESRSRFGVSEALKQHQIISDDIRSTCFGLVWTAYSQNKAFVISISPWSCLKMSEAASILRLLASSGFGGGSGMKASHSIIFCLGKARSNQVVTSCYICTWMCLGLALNFGLPFFTSN